MQLFDIRADKPLAEQSIAGVEQVIATTLGCWARTKKSVELLSVEGLQPLALPADPAAMTSTNKALLVATNKEILRFDQRGKATGSAAVGGGVTALARVDDWIATGFGDGSIELHPAVGSKSTMRPKFTFARTPSTAVTRLMAGPMRTLVAGFADGSIGLWDQTDGARLRITVLHGAVTHLLLEKQHLYVTSELGDHRVWDLRAFYQDYCPLLRELWRHVKVSWHDGRPALRPPNPKHRCNQAPR